MAVGAVAVVVVSVAGCGGPAHRVGKRHTTTTTTAPALVIGHGGTATVAVSAVPSTTLNDHTLAGDNDATRDVASTVWAQVFEIGPGLKPELDTTVVQSAEVVSVNPQTVVYQIAPQAVWSDGVAVSAADFQYAWQSQRGGATDIDGTPDSVASTLGYRSIASVVSSNRGRTVTVTFKTPYADWESLFDDLLPAHIAEQVGWNHGFDHFDPAVFVSAGPWLIQTWTPGREVVLVHNPRWWGTVPSYRRIVLEAVPDPAVMARDLRTGRVQVAAPSTYGTSLLAQVTALPTIESETTLGTTMLQLVFNVRKSPLQSTVVRQGIAHLVNRTALAARVTEPLQPNTGPDGSHLYANMQHSYVDDDYGYDTVDPTAADSLLGAGGLVTDADGTWTSHGTPVTLSLTWAEDDPWSAAAGPLVAAELEVAGFDVTTAPVTATELEGTILPAGAFQLALVPVEATAYPSQLGGAYSPTATTGSPALDADWSGFDDPQVDTLFAQAESELSATTAAALYQRIDRALWQEMPTLPLLSEPDFMAYSASLSGVHDDPGGLGPFWGLSGWARLVAAPSST